MLTTIRCFKPAPEVYQLAARRLDVEPGAGAVGGGARLGRDWRAASRVSAAFVAGPGQVIVPLVHNRT